MIVSLVLLAFVSLFFLLAPLVSWANTRLVYPRRRFQALGEPALKINVVVPCKGHDELLEENMKRLAEQDYPDYRLTLVTDTADDGALPAIRRILDLYPRASHVVAGLTNSSAQRSHAQLAGFRSEGESELFVVCDTDLKVERGFLRELARPFLDPRVVAASAHHWVAPRSPGLAAYIHGCLAGYLTMLVGLPGMGWLWGGCFAIRRRTLEDLDIAAVWRGKVSDDTSLQRRLNSRGIRPVFVPTAVSQAREAPRTIGDFVRWYARQSHAGRVYLKPAWIASLALETAATLAVPLALALLVAGIVSPPWGPAAIPSAATLAVLMLSGVLVRQPYLRLNSIPLPAWLLLPLFAHSVIALALWRSAFMRRVRWGKTVYELNRDGTIRTVNRLP